MTEERERHEAKAGMSVEEQMKRVAAAGKPKKRTWSIKVSDDAYQELLRLQKPRETFSGTIARLIFLSVLLEKVKPYIEDAPRKEQELRAAGDERVPIEARKELMRKEGFYVE